MINVCHEGNGMEWRITYNEEALKILPSKYIMLFQFFYLGAQKGKETQSEKLWIKASE